MANRVQVNLGEGGRRRGSLPPARELRRLLTRAVRVTLAAHQVDGAEVSLTLLGDAQIAALNERYLGHEGPTDVISFPLYGPGEPPLGDVYIGVDQALRQALECGVPPAEELARLAVHGTLHVLGCDHPDGPEREKSPMWEKQEAIVREVIGR